MYRWKRDLRGIATKYNGHLKTNYKKIYIFNKLLGDSQGNMNIDMVLDIKECLFFFFRCDHVIVVMFFFFLSALNF